MNCAGADVVANVLYLPVARRLIVLSFNPQCVYKGGGGWGPGTSLQVPGSNCTVVRGLADSAALGARR